jgi:hypothetical protein
LGTAKGVASMELSHVLANDLLVGVTKLYDALLFTVLCLYVDSDIIPVCLVCRI